MKTAKTYRDLLEKLKGFTEEQLDCDLVVVDANEEYVPVKFLIEKEQEDDVLDKGHPFMGLVTHCLVSAE